MEWIRENWVFIIFFAIFIGMHLFGHGMHGGGCGGHGKDNEGDEHRGHSGNSSEKKKEKGGAGCC